MDWFSKWFGIHVCGPFTKWETHTGNFSRRPMFLDQVSVLDQDKEIHYTLRWQERSCEACGKVEQRRLEQ